VNTVKGYAAHESQTLEKVIQARNAAVAVPAGDIAGQAAANQQLGGALRGLLAIAESYPDLKANSQFLELQRTLQDIEGELSNSRRYYNATVRDFNTSIQQFPGVFVARIGNFQPREFFELEDKNEAKNVEVKF
jgi:LemA protein